jgi:hypothetical protein
LRRPDPPSSPPLPTIEHDTDVIMGDEGQHLKRAALQEDGRAKAQKSVHTDASVPGLTPNTTGSALDTDAIMGDEGQHLKRTAHQMKVGSKLLKTALPHQLATSNVNSSNVSPSLVATTNTAHPAGVSNVAIGAVPSDEVAINVAMSSTAIGATAWDVAIGAAASNAALRDGISNVATGTAASNLSSALATDSDAIMGDEGQHLKRAARKGTGKTKKQRKAKARGKPQERLSSLQLAAQNELAASREQTVDQGTPGTLAESAAEASQHLSAFRLAFGEASEAARLQAGSVSTMEIRFSNSTSQDDLSMERDGGVATLLPTSQAPSFNSSDQSLFAGNVGQQGRQRGPSLSASAPTFLIGRDGLPTYGGLSFEISTGSNVSDMDDNNLN